MRRKEESLSDKKKIPFDCIPDKNSFYFYSEEDVKEFIKKLKEAHFKHTKDDYFLNVINKLAGDKLITNHNQ